MFLLIWPGHQGLGDIPAPRGGRRGMGLWYPGAVTGGNRGGAESTKVTGGLKRGKFIMPLISRGAKAEGHWLEGRVRDIDIPDL